MRRDGTLRAAAPSRCTMPMNGDNFSISALFLSMKVPYFSNSRHKNEKVTPLTVLLVATVARVARLPPETSSHARTASSGCRAMAGGNIANKGGRVAAGLSSRSS
eukprot:SAG31_NODE_1479_length_8180_cov_7.141684_8_plen_105_part_00